MALLVGLMSACTSTQRPLQLMPIADHSVVIDGKTVVKDEKDSVKLVVSFNGKFNEYMAFDTEIFNLSSKDMFTSPTHFQLIPLNENMSPIMADSISPIVLEGVEPREKMNDTNYQMALQDKKLKQAKVLNTVLFIGGIVAMASSSGRSSRHDRYSTGMELGNAMVQFASVKRIIDHENYYSNMDRLHNERRTWSEQGFNSNTLSAHTSLRGDVFVPIFKNAKYVQLVYKLPNNEITFLFEQHGE
jgi:hypothetical protein